MSTLSAPQAVHYPECDGKPMADNTLQFRWIVMLQGNIDDLFREDPNVFVAGDLLWYPVEGDNRTSAAPDTMVVFGRPKGDRRSYLQWLEQGIAPQVVFEVLSPNNRSPEMVRKFQFYERFGVEEYYLIDPDYHEGAGWIRRGDRFEEIEKLDGWVSPRLGIRFAMSDAELTIYRPNGAPFLTHAQLFEVQQRDQQRADAAQQRADAAQQRADAAQQRADAERERAERLAEKLRELGQPVD